MMEGGQKGLRKKRTIRGNWGRKKGGETLAPRGGKKKEGGVAGVQVPSQLGVSWVGGEQAGKEPKEGKVGEQGSGSTRPNSWEYRCMITSTTSRGGA